MATNKQIEANRNNSKKSTGPITAAGKEVSCLNALRHGIYAKHAVLPGEDRDTFERLCDQLEGEWDPKTPTEYFHLEQMVVAHWGQARIARNKAILMEDPEFNMLQSEALLDKFDNHAFRLQRSHDRAEKQLRALLTARLREQQRLDHEDDEEEYDDPFDDPNHIYPGLVWVDNNGKKTVKVPPATRDENGVFHDVPRERWKELGWDGDDE